MFTETEQCYNKLLTYLKTQTYTVEEAERSQLHTYTPATKKTYGYVLCGLNHQQTPDKVQEALLRTGDRDTSSLYDESHNPATIFNNHN